MRSAGCSAAGSSLYKRIISTENLFGAFYEFSRGKRYKEDVSGFEYDLEKKGPDLFIHRIHRQCPCFGGFIPVSLKFMSCSSAGQGARGRRG